MPPNEILFSPWMLAVLGLCIGSFLNVVIHRLPVMLERDWRAQLDELNPHAGAAAGDRDAALAQAHAHATTQVAGTYNLVVPRSACTACNAPIKSWQNIPVVSWLMLGGKCANCKAPISLRYPLVELCCALLSGAGFSDIEVDQQVGRRGGAPGTVLGHHDLDDLADPR